MPTAAAADTDTSEHRRLLMAQFISPSRYDVPSSMIASMVVTGGICQREWRHLAYVSRPIFVQQLLHAEAVNASDLHEEYDIYMHDRRRRQIVDGDE